MADQPAQAFLSYAHADDDYLNGGITWLREELQRAMRALTGEPLEILRDKDGVAFGEHWPDRIEDALIGASFLIPILTPSYFASRQCRAEAAAFMKLEMHAGRQGLVLPIYLIEADALEDPVLRNNDTIANTFHTRKPFDLRDVAFDLRTSPQTKRRMFELAKQIRDSTGQNVSPAVPDQKNYYRFWVNEKGQIDRAPDDAPDVDNYNLEMLAQQAGLLDACKRFLDPSRDSSAGRNFYGRLIDVVDNYEAAISGPLSEINYSEVWRLGSRLQNAWNAAERQIKRLEELNEEAPGLENEQKAAFEDLLTEHGPFILNTPAGREQQTKSERFKATQVEHDAKRAAGQAFNEAVQASDALYADATKDVIAEISKEQGEGLYPERHAVIADTTYQNLLALTGKAAKFAGKGAAFAAGAAATGVIGNSAYESLPLAKDLLNLSQPTIEAAKAFWLSNQPILVSLATASGEGLAWLPPFTDWLKTQTKATDQVAPKDAPTVITNDLWTPGRVFRDIDEPWCPEMVVIPAGEFMMGSPEDEERRRENEGPQRLVNIRKPFALGRYPVTFDEFDFFCDETDRERPSSWGPGPWPVTQVSWDDAMAYCAWLSNRTPSTYRLPSEAEWEYACRAGSTAAYAFGESIDKKQANFDGNVGNMTEVGTYPANAFKLHEMHGNIREWCGDHYRDGYMDMPVDGRPLLLSRVADRVARGGSWHDVAHHARSAYRDRYDPNLRLDVLGFRCARILE